MEARAGFPQPCEGSLGVVYKSWDAHCGGKGGAGPLQQPQHPSPSKGSSLWSAQDGFAACFDPDRDGSIECVQDVPAWAADLAARGDQDCSATCTSRDAQAQAADQHKAPAHASAGDDAAAVPDNHRGSAAGAWGRAQPALSKAEQLQQRSARQLEDLLAMIRNEQALERELCPKAGFLEQQDASAECITPQMIMIVSSWLSEVAYEFSMQQETLFLAIALLGRFLEASVGVPRGVLQLVAVACIMLAAKQDEVVHPSVQELTDIAANCFSAQDLLRMERILLDTLSWRVKTPTAYTFLHLYTQSTAALRAAGGLAAAAPREPLSGLVVAQAAYLTELALLDAATAAFCPSKVAAAALLLAQSWSPQGAAADEMAAVSGFGPAELSDCTARLTHLHHCAAIAEACGESLAPFVFIKDKYAQECWLKASLQQPPSAAAGLTAAAPLAPRAGLLPGDCGAQPMEC